MAWPAADTSHASSEYRIKCPLQVLRAEAPALGRPETGVALKVTDMPASVHDGHALVDTFSEVGLLESFSQAPSVCQVRDSLSLSPIDCFHCSGPLAETRPAICKWIALTALALFESQLTLCGRALLRYAHASTMWRRQAAAGCATHAASCSQRY